MLPEEALGMAVMWLQWKVHECLLQPLRDGSGTLLV